MTDTDCASSPLSPAVWRVFIARGPNAACTTVRAYTERGALAACALAWNEDATHLSAKRCVGDAADVDITGLSAPLAWYRRPRAILIERAEALRALLRPRFPAIFDEPFDFTYAAQSDLCDLINELETRALFAGLAFGRSGA